MEKEKLSFIPKTSFGAGDKSAYDYKQAGVGLVLKISVFLFVLSFIVFGGTLLYKNIINEQITELSASLDRAQAAFDLALILEIEKISSSISGAKALLGEHRFPTNIFDIIEELTHKDVGFNRFSYLYDPESESKNETEKETLKISLAGEAKDYISLAQQSKILEDSEDVSDFSFLNFSLTQEGRVSFLLEIMFDLPVLFKSL